MSLVELLDRRAHVVVRAECLVCADGEPTLTRDCAACDATGMVDELVPVMDFVRFVLEHAPEGVPATNRLELDGHVGELRKALAAAVDRSNRRSISESARQEAFRTVSECAQAIANLRAAAT